MKKIKSIVLLSLCFAMLVTTVKIPTTAGTIPINHTGNSMIKK